MQDNEPHERVEAEDFSENENPLTEQEEVNKNQDLERLQSELTEQKDKYVRLFAEFDNFKRRTYKENLELRQTAGKELITSLLPVLDDMERAEEQMSKSDKVEEEKKGILLIFNKFRKILEAKGLVAIDTLHTVFDVEKDEAISEMAVDDKKLKGKVVAEIQKGYLLNDKLIRFAQVVVGK